MNNDNYEGVEIVKLPVKIYGGNPTDFAEFMTEYHQMAVAHGMSEKTMIQRLPIYLKGMARSVYNNLLPANLLTWPALITAMSEKLLTGDVGRLLRQQFYQRRQRKDESVGEFAYQLELVAERAFGGKADWTVQIKKDY